MNRGTLEVILGRKYLKNRSSMGRGGISSGIKAPAFFWLDYMDFEGHFRRKMP
jgi:hypothetical protein